MKLKKLSPWETYYKELDAMFKHDGDVHIVFDEDAYKIKMYVNDDAKASALAELIPTEKKLGNITLKIDIVPANGFMEVKNVYDMAFLCNPVVAGIIETFGVFRATYVIFKAEVVQYYDDNIGDYYGNCSTLYQDIARNIFNQKEGVFFCTNKV